MGAPYLNGTDGSWMRSNPIPAGCSVHEVYDADGLVSRIVNGPGDAITPGAILDAWQRPEHGT